RIVAVQKEGYPIGINWNQSFESVAYWADAKNGPNPEASKEFPNCFLGNPEAHAGFSNEVNYDTGNRTSLALVPEAEQSSRIAFPANLATVIKPDYAWLADNSDMLLDRWNAWIIQ